jgi:hypothetical protein
MTADAKHRALMFLLLATLALILIAAALPQLELLPGLPLPGIETARTTEHVDDTTTVTISVGTYMKALLEVVTALVVAFVAYRLIMGVPWRDVLIPGLAIAALGLILLSILFALQGVRIKPELEAPQVLPPALAPTGEPLGPLPVALIWLVWIGLAVALVLLGAWLAYRRHADRPAGDPLRLEAEHALQALRTGRDLANVIVHCYRQMTVALQEECGLARGEAMTAREFERLLQARGIPYEPVHQLTRLFEAARYGSRRPGPDEEGQAVECLSAIVQYSREWEQAP